MISTLLHLGKKQDESRELTTGKGRVVERLKLLVERTGRRSLAGSISNGDSDRAYSSTKGETSRVSIDTGSLERAGKTKTQRDRSRASQVRTAEMIQQTPTQPSIEMVLKVRAEAKQPMMTAPTTVNTTVQVALTEGKKGRNGRIGMVLVCSLAQGEESDGI
jgi:hypothetical protein